jgi:hypothetical protein
LLIPQCSEALLLFFFRVLCRKELRTCGALGSFEMRVVKFGAAVAALVAASSPALAESTVLRNVTVIDGTGAPAKPNSAILMTDGKIAYVGPMSGLKAPAGAKDVDLSGKFVMPGIIDSHVHLGMMHDVTQDEKYETPENVQADLKQYAAYGVTTVQVLGTDKDFVLDMRNQQRKSRPTMARIFSAGRGAVIKGGYGGLLGVTSARLYRSRCRPLFSPPSSTRRTRSICAPWRMSSIWPTPRRCCAQAWTVSGIWCATYRWTRNS